MNLASTLLALSSAIILSASSIAAELPVVGTGDGIPVLQAVGGAFSADSGTVVLVPPSIHSSGAVREVSAGRAVLGRVARPLKPQEKALGLIATPVFRQPAVFYAHTSAGVSNLSLDQVTKIYGGEITNWREVGGADARIRVVRRETVDSTLNVFRETLPGWKDLQILERSKMATTTQEAFDSVQETPGAIGFGPYSLDLEKRVVVLNLDGKKPDDEEYPSAVTLALIHHADRLTEEAAHFLDFCFTPKAQEIVRALGAIPVKTRLAN
jgi:phosphate transport system substrate-binding protein